MAGTERRLDSLTSSERRALRDVLLAAVSAADAADGDPVYGRLRRLSDVAPMALLPDAAALHRLAGVVLRGLGGVDGVDPEVRARLTEMQGSAQFWQLLYVGALAEVAREFDDAGLTWVVMKGPVLAAHYYADPGDRGYGDLDLLVARRDFPAAVRILERMGYRHEIHNWALAEEMMAGEISMSTDLLSIDLHWHLHYSDSSRRPYDLSPEEMMARRRQISLGPMSAPTFDPVDTLLSLCFHAARSDGHRLIWFKDLERVLVIDEPDLDRLVGRAASLRIGPPVGIMLTRAKALVGAPVPDAVIEALAPAALRTLDRRVRERCHPIQFHEGDTITRRFTRSVRSSVRTTVAEVPLRTARLLGRRWFPPAVNETDDELEKERYLRAVATSS